MTINISPEDTKLFEQNGFSKEQVGATVEHYRQQGMSDDDIQAKMDSRINEWKSSGNFDPEGNQVKPLEGGVSFDWNNAEQAIKENPAKAIDDMLSQSYTDTVTKTPLGIWSGAWKGWKNTVNKAQKVLGGNWAENKINDFRESRGQAPIDFDKINGIEKPQGGWEKAGAFIGETAPYLALPEIKSFEGAGLAARVGNSALTAGYQGGLIGGLNSLADKGDLSGAGKGGVIGTILGATIPLGGAAIKAGTKPIGTAAEWLTSKFTGLTPKTIQQAIKPNSRALDLNEDTAQNLLMNTTERVRAAYNNLLNKRGADVNTEAKKLGYLGDRIPARDLRGDINDIFNSYQGVRVNPARNSTGNLEQDLYDLVESGRGQQSDLDNLINSGQNNQNLLKYEQKGLQNEARNRLEEIGEAERGNPQLSGSSGIYQQNYVRALSDFGAGTGGQMGAYTFGSRGSLVVKPETAQYFDALGLPKLKFSTDVNPNVFYNDLKKLKEANPAQYAQVDLHTPEEYANMRLFRGENGAYGFAITPDGEVVSVFSNGQIPQAGTSMVMAAKSAGGKHLSNYDTYLSKIYNRQGFNETSRMPWDEQYIPRNEQGEVIWNKDIYGEPDVTERALNPDNTYITTISPVDVNKMKQQIGKSINWSDETARNYKNPILERLYGKFNQRLSELSPELKAANEAYARLRGFQKNEGLNRVLKNGENIDSAAQQLKNYNNTITKGNTNRNVQDLEQILQDNGYGGFLNDIDDVNAAQNMTNSLTTGRNFLGAQDLQKGLAILGLRAGRGINRNQSLQSIYNSLGQPVPGWLMPILYGGTNSLISD